MTHIYIKRIYDLPSSNDGYRVLVDRLWPRGVKKEEAHFDEWEKELAPSTALREWFHANPDGHWSEFMLRYKHELSQSDAVRNFISQIKQYQVVTLLYASKDTVDNNARVLQEYLQDEIKKV